LSRGALALSRRALASSRAAAPRLARPTARVRLARPARARQYECRSALETLHELSPRQFETGWVQHQLGRCYFEMADYAHAKRALEAMQQAEPHRMEGLEVRSFARR